MKPVAVILLVASVSVATKAAVLSGGQSDLSWNSLLNANIFPENLDRIASTKHTDGPPPPPPPSPEHVTGQLKALLARPGVLAGVYKNYLALFNKNETPIKGNTSLSRVQVFQDKLLKIAAHNMAAQAGHHSWTMGVNQFTDKTQSELKLPRWPISGPTTTFAKLDAIYNYTKLLQGAPDTLDYRTQGIVSPVKDQMAGCIDGGGACYAFTSAGSAESAHARQTGEILDLSEKEIVDCNYPGHDGCDGGDLYQALSYMKGGVALEDEYPYVGTHAPSGQCQADGKSRNAAVGEVQQVIDSDEAGLIALLLANGPVAIAVAADSDAWSPYRGGIYKGKCAPELSHGVIVVGYTPDAWILKNSWNTWWGDQGYMYLDRGSGSRCKLFGYLAPILSMA